MFLMKTMNADEKMFMVFQFITWSFFSPALVQWNYHPLSSYSRDSVSTNEVLKSIFSHLNYVQPSIHNGWISSMTIFEKNKCRQFIHLTRSILSFVVQYPVGDVRIVRLEW